MEAKGMTTTKRFGSFFAGPVSRRLRSRQCVLQLDLDADVIVVAAPTTNESKMLPGWAVWSIAVVDYRGRRGRRRKGKPNPIRN